MCFLFVIDIHLSREEGVPDVEADWVCQSNGFHHREVKVRGIRVGRLWVGGSTSVNVRVERLCGRRLTGKDRQSGWVSNMDNNNSNIRFRVQPNPGEEICLCAVCFQWWVWDLFRVFTVLGRGSIYGFRGGSPQCLERVLSKNLVSSLRHDEMGLHGNWFIRFRGQSHKGRRVKLTLKKDDPPVFQGRIKKQKCSSW